MKIKIQERSIKIQLFNIRSLRKNLDHFVSRSAQEDADVIVLTKTWLYSVEEDVNNIEGYQTFFKSNETYRAGGVAIYIKINVVAGDRTGALSHKVIDYAKLKEKTDLQDWTSIMRARGPSEALLILQDGCTGVAADCTTSRPVTNKFKPMKDRVTPGLVRPIRKREDSTKSTKRRGNSMRRSSTSATTRCFTD